MAWAKPAAYAVSRAPGAPEAQGAPGAPSPGVDAGAVWSAKALTASRPDLPGVPGAPEAPSLPRETAAEPEATLTTASGSGATRPSPPLDPLHASPGGAGRPLVERFAPGGGPPMPHHGTSVLVPPDGSMESRTAPPHVAGPRDSVSPMEKRSRGFPLDSWADVVRLPLLAAAIAAALLLPTWVLSRRLRRDRLLDLPMRREIFDRVSNSPGVSLQDLARALGVHFTTVEYHARVLVEYGILTQERAWGRLRLFTNGGTRSRNGRALATALSVPTARRVLHAVSATPGASTSGVARALRLPVSTASWNLHRLAADGLLVREGAPGEAARWRVAPEAVSLPPDNFLYGEPSRGERRFPCAPAPTSP